VQRGTLHLLQTDVSSGITSFKANQPPHFISPIWISRILIWLFWGAIFLFGAAMLHTNVQTATEITLGEIVATFIAEELFSLSPQTEKWYRCRLGLFVEAMGAERPLSSIGKPDLLAWWKSLESRTTSKPKTLTVDTFHGYVRAARRLFKWMYEQHIIETELYKFIKLPKLPERERKGIDDQSLRKFLQAAQESPRDYAILMFMESTGCRRGGVASLTFDELQNPPPARHCPREGPHRPHRHHERGGPDRFTRLAGYSSLGYKFCLCG
jgi:hypothetical protein